jgi:4-amino-4-deoxy-L-arabinose transferase-like glycosyltransferase
VADPGFESSPPANVPPGQTSSGRLALVLIVLLGLSLRCISLSETLTDMHGQRQVDTATMARYFYEDSPNILRPQVNWGGRHGYVESEFPLQPFLAFLLFKVFGPSDALGRLVSIVFSTAAIWALYKLGEILMGPAEGRAAAFLFAVSPSAVFYGRAFMPDAPMVFFSIAGVWCWCRYFKTNETSMLWLGGTLSALAWLVKLPGAVTVAPILASGWLSRRRPLVRDVRFLVVMALAVAVTVAWYWHASAIYDSMGLSVGLHPPKSYPPSIGPGPWVESISKWSPTLLADPQFYDTMLRYIFFTHLTPIGFAVAIVGAMLWRQPARLVADAWLAAMVVFMLATPLVNRWHDYYQLLLLPPAALYFAVVAGRLFDGAWLSRHVVAPRFATALAGVVVTVVGLLAFWMSGVIDSHFRPRPGAVDSAEAGQALSEVASRDDLAVVIDGFGVNSPMLLYWAHMRGWGFDIQSLTPSVMDRLYQRGARYFVTTRWGDVQHDNPALAEYVKAHHQIALRQPRRDMVVFDLNDRR